MGDGKGLATYSKNDFNLDKTITMPGFQITVYSSSLIQSVAVYRSAGTSLVDVTNAILSHLDHEKVNVILGDVNVCVKKEPNNVLTDSLLGIGFKQMSNKPTHTQGGIIDHTYVRDAQGLFGTPILYRFSPYYSDHHSLCLSLPISTPQVILGDHNMHCLTALVTGRGPADRQPSDGPQADGKEQKK